MATEGTDRAGQDKLELEVKRSRSDEIVSDASAIAVARNGLSEHYYY